MSDISPTYRSVSYQRTILWLPFTVFILAYLVRTYWIHEKENLYGDELTSICIAYDHPGWGEKTFQSYHVYTGQELRQQIFLDDRGGIQGLFHDLAVLHHDNRDASHASLYYMALRCALSGTDQASMDVLVRRSCGLNLLFFSLSFLCLYSLLNDLFPRRRLLITFCLLLAYLNPSSISNVLLARKYQMSECLFILWALWCWKMNQRILRAQPLWQAAPLGSGILISAALLSCGYFNGFFLMLTGSFLLFHSIRRYPHKSYLSFYAALCIGCLAVCFCLYNGFFNFFHDARTMEVTDKMKGHSLMSNLSATFIGGSYIAIIRTLTPIWGGVIAAIVAAAITRRNNISIPRLPSAWLFTCVLCWTLIVLWLATWKSTRFITSGIPLLMTAVAYYSHAALQHLPKLLGAFLISLFTGYAGLEYPIEHLERNEERTWLASDAQRVLLFGPDNDEKNTLQLLIPHLTDQQECVIVERPEDIHSWVGKEDTHIYVYGESGCPVLKSAPGYRSEKEFNEWMGCFTFTAQ